MPHHSSRKQHADHHGDPQHGAMQGGVSPHAAYQASLLHQAHSVHPYHPSMYIGRQVPQSGVPGVWSSHGPLYNGMGMPSVNGATVREDSSVGSSSLLSQGSNSRCAPSPPSIQNRHSNSFDSPQQMAATALLMASKTVTPKEHGAGPLKKRKKTDVHAGHSGSSYYVSPISDKAPHRTASESSSSRGSSYDSKDAEALHESSKVTDTTDIAAHSEGVTAGFPSVLHQVLADAEMENVIQWLPHGKSWRIVRFDALKKQVLPKYLPTLCVSGDGSIDAFLKQLSIWGFEEVTDGPDVGAYSNLLFRRGVPQLSDEMKPSFASPSKVKFDTGKVVSPEMGKERSRDEPNSILRVPSLVSATGTVDTLSSKDGSQNERKDESKEVPFTSNRGRRSSIAAAVNYRPDAMPESWSYSFRESLPGGTMSTKTSRSIPYSPVRVRSSRGSAAMGRTVGAPQPHILPVSRRSSFPMSSRGRVSGRGTGRSSLNLSRRGSLAPSISPVRTNGDTSAARINKRKLPMAASKATEQS